MILDKEKRFQVPVQINWCMLTYYFRSAYCNFLHCLPQLFAVVFAIYCDKQARTDYKFGYFNFSFVPFKIIKKRMSENSNILVNLF
ncbi:hypothetical protein BZG01_11180 [Labilibaculum manganireducens]|uniref:Uncharacterized protein n=1 Tax=Labilibaculum manganireducens TaxID=1940525 RepID=A0A2N3I7Q8_9BACT|nr:hypothetical protein BZG01_11180 [Labilibaculum manganireducens]